MSERRDDDPQSGVGEAEAVTPGERARAEALGRRIDDLLAGRAMPPAMDSDDRAMVESATVVLASSRALELSPERTRRLVDQALESAMMGRRHERAGGHASEQSATDLRVRRRRADRVLRHVPWVVASAAAAAAVLFFVLRRTDRRAEGVPRGARPAPALRLSVSNTSRPADPLIGVIERAAAGGARERIDVIFADRLDGYRDLRMRRALAEENP